MKHYALFVQKAQREDFLPMRYTVRAGLGEAVVRLMSQSFRSYSLFGLQFGAVFGAYFLSAWLGLQLNVVNDFAAFIWPATGVAIASVYFFGIRLGFAIALAAFAVNFISGAPPAAALAIGAGNALEAVGAVLLLRSFRFEPYFARLIDSFSFVAVALSVTILSASIGTSALVLTGVISSSELPLTWLAWWIGDSLGALIVAPFLIRWFSHPFSASTRSFSYFFESVVFFTVLIATTLVVFWEPFGDFSLVAYLVFVPLTWGALRVGPRFMTGGILTLSALATMGTLAGTGPFAPIVGINELFMLQLFLATVACIFLFFVSAVEERKESAKRLEKHVVTLEHNVQTISESDQAKNDFIAILSHELRNPLAPIVSSLEIMRVRGVTETDVGELVETTYANVQRMSRLLDDLLDVARISRKKFTLQKENISLQKILEQSAAMAAPEMQRFGHTLTLSLSKDDIRVEADPLRIEQVVVNLLNNAAKYTPRGGTISLTSERTVKGTEIRVRDSGMGIPSDMLTKIFEPFRQLGHASGERSSGLGIGLSLAKRLVELHGGTIEAVSAGKGLGSEFIVRLPVANPTILLPASSTQKPEHKAPPARKRKRAALIVDDNYAAASAIAKLLNHTGHEARTAPDGATALAILADFRPDVIFLDIGLPGESGYQVAEKIRKYLDPAPLLVALTGYGQEDDKQRALEAGFDHHVTKPVGIAELEKILMNASS